jgi:hypothetical protein
LFHSPASQQLISDEIAVRGAVTAIRNSLVPPSERRPSSLTLGTRTYGRLSIQAAVSLLPAVVGDSRVAILDESPISARTRDVSLGGIGLVHSMRFPGRYAIVVFSAEAPIWFVVGLLRSCPEGDEAWLSATRILGLIESAEAPTGIL